eukprot:1562763-Amphidinium_carterae.1
MWCCWRPKRAKSTFVKHECHAPKVPKHFPEQKQHKSPENCQTFMFHASLWRFRVSITMCWNTKLFHAIQRCLYLAVCWVWVGASRISRLHMSIHAQGGVQNGGARNVSFHFWKHASQEVVMQKNSMLGVGWGKQNFALTHVYSCARRCAKPF